MSSCFCGENGCTAGEGQCEYNSACKCGNQCKVWCEVKLCILLHEC
jgi:hypothetical protein